MNAKASVPFHRRYPKKITGFCLASCQKLISQIQKAKNSILTEYRERRATRQHMLELALTEAEALAWQTSYPHLVFPLLAQEKAEEVAAWERRQRSIRGNHVPEALAA